MAKDSGGGRRVRRGGMHMEPISEINVTPFVDVMLVLLIVFMVAAPMLTVSVPIDLPQTGSASTEEQPLVVSVQKGGRIFVQDEEVTAADLVAKVNALTKVDPERRIFIRGDKAIEYGDLVTVMFSLSAAGYHKIGLVSTVTNQ